MRTLFIASTIVQILLALHAQRRGKGLGWILFILFIPVAGAALYLISMWRSRPPPRPAPPSSLPSPAPAKPQRTVGRLTVVDTAQSAIASAEAHLEQDDFSAAKLLCQRSLAGVHANNPHLMLSLAQAQFGLGEYAEAVATLDDLIAQNPDFHSPQGHLLYARAQEESDNIDAAMHEYQALLAYYDGPEPACRLGLLLKAKDKRQEAHELFRWIVDHYPQAHRRDPQDRQWLDIARRELGHH